MFRHTAGWIVAMLSLAAVACSGSASPTPGAAAPPDPPPAVVGQPADAAADAVDPAAEVEALRAAVARDPGDSRSRRMLAIALLEGRDKQEAIELFEQLAADDPSTGNLLNLAQAYAQVSRLGDAEASYEQLLAREPEQPNALHGLGNLAFKRAETERAIEWYRKAVAARPDYLLAHLHLGDALKDSGQYEEAYNSYGRVLELEPTTQQDLEAYLDALYQMASLDLTMGAYERAANLLEELLQIHPRHDKANYAYGQALLQLGRPEEAQAAFARHMEIVAAKTPDAPMAMGDR